MSFLKEASMQYRDCSSSRIFEAAESSTRSQAFAPFDRFVLAMVPPPLTSTHAVQGMASSPRCITALALWTTQWMLRCKKREERW